MWFIDICLNNPHIFQPTIFLYMIRNEKQIDNNNNDNKKKNNIYNIKLKLCLPSLFCLHSRSFPLSQHSSASSLRLNMTAHSKTSLMPISELLSLVLESLNSENNFKNTKCCIHLSMCVKGIVRYSKRCLI